MRPALALLLLLFACDQPKTEASREASAPLPPATSVAPPPPKAPKILVESGVVTVDGTRVTATEPALGARLAPLVSGKPKVEDEVVEIDAIRGAKPSHVALTVAVLRKAGARGAIVKSETRDKSSVEGVPVA